MFGAEQSVRTRTADDERRALQARLLTSRFVDDLRLEATPLGPLEVHAKQHLDPILGFDAALADRDGDDCVVVGVGIGEEEVELVRAQLTLESCTLLGDLALQVGVVAGELVELAQVAISSRLSEASRAI